MAFKLLELLEGGAVPEHITRHMKAVSKLAVNLGMLLNIRGGCELNLSDIELAALLHDMRRAEANHAAAAAAVISDAGGARIAEIVRQHMLPDKAERDNISEITVLYIADKMADGERVISIEERYAKRLKDSPLGPRRRAAEYNLGVAMAIKGRMEELIGEKITPELLSNEPV
ncbi:hypothetical protein AGMMS50276_03560 [Synergistales bacterium]|nr:hypothetical protein AGMMS50276_03560 [Synergistales bacterium]